MLGETGSSYACKLPGYYGTGSQVMPAQDAADMQAKYGRYAVVTDDDVERVLRQNGYRFDD